MRKQTVPITVEIPLELAEFLSLHGNLLIRAVQNAILEGKRTAKAEDLLLYGVVQGAIGVMSENSLITSVLLVTSGFERDEITSYSYQRHRFTSIVFER